MTGSPLPTVVSRRQVLGAGLRDMQHVFDTNTTDALVARQDRVVNDR